MTFVSDKSTIAPCGSPTMSLLTSGSVVMAKTPLQRLSCAARLSTPLTSSTLVRRSVRATIEDKEPTYRLPIRETERAARTNTIATSG
jgi:hypothetical protein